MRIAVDVRVAALEGRTNCVKRTGMRSQESHTEIPLAPGIIE